MIRLLRRGDEGALEGFLAPQRRALAPEERGGYALLIR